MSCADRPCRARAAALAALAALAWPALSGCGGMADDLFPSGADRRPTGNCGTEGPNPCQVAPDFTLLDTAGDPVTLSAALAGKRGAVLYFTMWCDDCISHLGMLRADAMPAHPDLAYLALDYVSGDAPAVASMVASMGWSGAGFTFLADVGQRWTGYFHAGMAVVVVDADRVVRYSGYCAWERLQPVLAALPPVAARAAPGGPP
jgi:hypothetical protein